MFLRLNNLIKFARVSRPICQSVVRLNEDKSKDISGSVATKFQVFRNETGIIFDIEEERRRQEEHDVEEFEDFPSAFNGINLERGVKGVFEIEDLVDVLRKENANNLCVIKVPEELKYVDYLCIVTGNSNRHMVGMAHFVRKCYKLKKKSSDIIPKIEGEKCRNWIAMDLGNIALHIFTRQSRKYYDLETLWCLGEDYEKRTKRTDATESMYQKYLDAATASAGKNTISKETDKAPINNNSASVNLDATSTEKKLA